MRKVMEFRSGRSGLIPEASNAGLCKTRVPIFTVQLKSVRFSHLLQQQCGRAMYLCFSVKLKRNKIYLKCWIRERGRKRERMPIAPMCQFYQTMILWANRKDVGGAVKSKQNGGAANSSANICLTKNLSFFCHVEELVPGVNLSVCHDGAQCGRGLFSVAI